MTNKKQSVKIETTEAQSDLRVLEICSIVDNGRKGVKMTDEDSTTVIVYHLKGIKKAKANAKEIIKRVNLFDELKEALQGLTDTMSNMQSTGRISSSPIIDHTLMEALKTLEKENVIRF